MRKKLRKIFAIFFIKKILLLIGDKKYFLFSNLSLKWREFQLIFPFSRNSFAFRKLEVGFGSSKFFGNGDQIWILRTRLEKNVEKILNLKLSETLIDSFVKGFQDFKNES